MKGKTMLIILLSFLIVHPVIVFSQDERKEIPRITLSSMIIDQDGNPVEGAWIFGEGGSVRVRSGSDGFFTINVPENSLLLIESEGFSSVRILPENGSIPGSISIVRISYQLTESDDVNLPFHVLKRRNVTGSISVLDPDEILKYDGNQDFYNALNGRVPGLFGSTDVYGLGLALLVVDGIPRPAGILNLQEIEQITVLKDAVSRNLYGSQANLPVILVTTKQGESFKRVLDIRLETGLMNPIAYPDYLGAAEYMDLYNEALQNDGLLPRYDQQTIDNTRNSTNPVLYPDEDYYNSTYLRKNQTFYNLSAQASGGNNVARYYAFLGWSSERSLLKLGRGESDDQFNVRGNVDYRITDFMKMRFMGLAVFDVEKGPNGDFWGNSSTFLPNLYPVLIPASESDLQYTTSLIDGQYLLGGTSEYRTNIYGDLVQAGYLNSNRRYLVVNMALDFDLNSLVKGLTASVTVSFDNYIYYQTQLLNQYAVYEPQVVDGVSGDSVSLVKHGLDVKQGSESIANSSFYRKFGLFGTLNYDRTFADKHEVHVMGLAYRDQTENSGTYVQVKNHHFGLQAGYGFLHKYIAQFSGVFAGSPAFAAENRYAFSPAVGFAWVISEEDFFSPSMFLKLKTSWGRIHTDQGLYPNYLYRSNFSRSSNFYYDNRVNINQIAIVSNLGNPDLEWMKRCHFNAGFESSFLDYTLTIEGGYFRSRFFDVISLRENTYPSLMGQLPYENYASYLDQGMEFGLNYNRSLNEWRLNIGTNLVYAVPKVLQMDELDYEYDYLKQTGKPTDAIFGWVDEGLYSELDFTNGELNSGIPVPTFGDVQPGDIRYKDLNEDDIIDNNDREIIGYYNPNLQYSLNLTIGYKIFDLFLLGTGQTGRSTVYNSPYYWVYGERKYPEMVTGRWTPATSATATYPRLSSTSNSNNFRYSTYWLRKNDWFTLHTAQLNINLPERLAERSFIKGLQFYLRTYNLFTISKNREIMELNIGTEPQFRTYAVGINATF